MTEKIDSLKHNAESHNSSNNHSEVSHHNVKKDPMKEILSSLGDHNDLTWSNKVLSGLPVILVDDGIKVYPSIHSMKESGEYKFDHHKIVRADNHNEPTLNLSITNLIAFQLFAALLLVFIFIRVVSKYKINPLKAPTGLQNLIETLVVYVRDEVVRPNIPNRKLADGLMPYFLVIFFFIFVMNLIGLLPGGHTPTGSLSITAALAFTSFLVINGAQIKQEGLIGYLKHLTAGAPLALAPLLFIIELAGQFIKPIVLAIRLFANMTAGHTVLFTFIGLILVFKSWLAAGPFVAFSLFVYLLEILVAFLQAFIFTMLTAIFVGLGIHPEHKHHGEVHSH